jgi:hypothetical protein
MSQDFFKICANAVSFAKLLLKAKYLHSSVMRVVDYRYVVAPAPIYLSEHSEKIKQLVQFLSVFIKKAE